MNQSDQEEDEVFNPNDPLLQARVNDPRWLPLRETIGKSPEPWDAIEYDPKLT
jgi:hypothetical protein